MPFVKRHRTYYKYGTEPNASIVGSFARIDKGVASGFSSANYLTLPTTFKPENNSWEMCFKIYTGSAFTSNPILGKYTSNTYYGLRLEFTVDGTLYYLVSSTGSDNHIVEGRGSNVLPTNSDVYIKFSFTGSKYIGEISLDGGLTWIVDKEVVTTTPIYNWDSITTLGYFAGTEGALASASIDLSQSYIKINGSRWWSGDSYTKVGSWIDDGVVSGFTTGNYLTTKEVFNPQNNPWEQVWSVTTGANTSTTYPKLFAQTNVGTTAVSGFDLRLEAGKIRLWVEATSFTGATVLQDYTHYLIKAEFTGSAYILSYSTDNGASWVEDCNVASTLIGVPDMNVPQYIGRWGYSTSPDPWLGTIDLTQSYIKINNKDWWHGTKAYQVNLGGEDVYEDWTQPVLTANGTIGGNKFAVYTPNTVDQNGPIYNAFNESATIPHIYDELPASIVFYNPNPLKIKSILLNQYGASYWVKGVFQGCNDNSSWTDIKPIDFSGTSITFEVNSATAYKYHRFYITSAYSNDTLIGKIQITAQELVQVGSNDYDYYVNHNKLYQLATNKRSYWKYEYQDFAQPILSADGTLGGKSFACQMLNNPVNSAYLAFDGNTSTNARINSGASSSSSFTFYNPNPLKISTIIINGSGNNNNEYMSAGKLYGSNDNSSWTELLTFSGLSYGNYTLAVNSDNFYKYHKFMPTSLCSAGYWTLAELTITAQEQIAVEVNLGGEDVYEDWKQPVPTSNGVMGGNKFACNQSSVYSSSYAWMAFASGLWHSAEGQNPPQWLSWYNPRPLRIDNIEIVVGNNSSHPDLPNDYKIQGSNNNTDWVDVYSGTNTQTSPIPLTLSIDLTNNPNRVYKYWRYYVVNVKSRNFGNAQKIKIKAKELVKIGGAIEDADTYTDKLLSYEVKRPYYYTFTVNPKPSDAVVTLNGQATNALTIRDGLPINWQVSLDGWTTQSGKIIVNADKEITVDLMKEFPAEPTYTTLLHAAGANASQSMTVEEEGWYRFHYYNTYGASDRWGYASIDGVTKYSWQSSQNSYTDPIYLEVGQVVRVWNNRNGYTLNTYFEKIT